MTVKKGKMPSRILAFFLMLVMTFTSLPVHAFADESAQDIAPVTTRAGAPSELVLEELEMMLEFFEWVGISEAPNDPYFFWPVLPTDFPSLMRYVETVGAHTLEDYLSVQMQAVFHEWVHADHDIFTPMDMDAHFGEEAVSSAEELFAEELLEELEILLEFFEWAGIYEAPDDPYFFWPILPTDFPVLMGYVESAGTHTLEDYASAQMLAAIYEWVHADHDIFSPADMDALFGEEAEEFGAGISVSELFAEAGAVPLRIYYLPNTRLAVGFHILD